MSDRRFKRVIKLCSVHSIHSEWKSRQMPFSSPEPVVSWSRGRETRGSGSSRYRMSENFWHPVAHVQKLQISLLMLITDFCPSPLHWGKNFTSWALSREWLVWDVLKMLHFTQLGFTDNRPFALRGHVTSFLWKWKLYDFTFKKRLVGHILNKIMAIWFFKPAPFS